LYIAFIIYLKKEGSSMDNVVFENPLLKYIACFNIHDNEKQENIGTALCFAWLLGLCEMSPS
jgi:hypothetical protein